MLPSPGIAGHQHHQQHHQPSPPSPPLPPPPPPPPLDTSIPRSFLRPIPVKREDKLFSTQEVSKRGCNQFLTHISESPSPPSAQVRRSLSVAKNQGSKVSESVEVKEATPTKHNQDVTINTLPKVNGQMVLRKPGNLFLSQLYFLFHLSLVVCILRANG